MTRLTRDDIIQTVGQVDDVTVAEIIGTGATAEEWRKPRPGRSMTTHC